LCFGGRLCGCDAGRERGRGHEPNETNHNHFLSPDAVAWI
jgi:hypothetical protein